MVMRSLLTDDRTSLKIGSCCCGIPIALHYSYFLLLVIELAASARYLDAAFSLFILTLYGPVLLLTIVIHELGHAWMTKRLGGDVGGIVLWPLGGFALCGPTDCGASGDFKVSIAGPLTHIPQMAFWIAMYAAFAKGDFSRFDMSYYLNELSEGGASFFAVLSQQAFWTNLFIMAFNLFVPAYPLDGGRCLADLLIMRGVRIEKAALITSVTAMVLSGGLLLFGLVSFIWLHSPNGIFMALVASYVFSNSMSLFKMQKEGRVREHPLFGRAVLEEREDVARTTSSEEPESVSSPKAEDAEMA
mmetsp:Transcript_11393/g.25527  ORF Transcript_11393/g.25527 Transcript_11393/m.25527 type:complete len:302 (-) Transcript_11393:159-1064(-)|eukprot:CAMPEP_0178488394 /NCGR_PEP_ID=MMETSP0696-20121128/9835_1 /TAXON_ID=265572 /ORGANISM="Extubocellulus spinifer, Strain CCMP396" /LENGTH=301 /DNA_ID=CAMNT_0020116157 /DNA_START=108 /DNA_END=1013 /DNA_ORIENTATION=-